MDGRKAKEVELRLGGIWSELERARDDAQELGFDVEGLDGALSRIQDAADAIAEAVGR